MPHPRTMNPDSLQDMQVIDNDGDTIGKVSAVFLDVENGKPEWAAVKTSLVGGHETLVPLANASATDTELTLPYTKDTIKNAPHRDPETQLTTQEEADLFRHYGVPYSGETVTADTDQLSTDQPSADQPSPDQPSTDRDAGASTAQQIGHDTSGPTTDEAMTRSEERLRVSTENVEAGRARLRKHIVTETVTQTVTLSHEAARLEREPITEADRAAAMSGAELTEEVHEVVLHAERPVVHKETVPVERVRLRTETVTGEQQVSEQVRKEQIEQVVDVNGGNGGNGGDGGIAGTGATTPVGDADGPDGPRR